MQIEKQIETNLTCIQNILNINFLKVFFVKFI